LHFNFFSLNNHLDYLGAIYLTYKKIEMYDFDPKKNYYEILWIDESADKDEIKKTFKKLAVKYHPDKAWWNKEKFQEINEAYQVLSNDQKKQQYDMFRKWGGGFWWFEWWGFEWWGFEWWGFDFGWVDLWDLIGSAFGGWFGGGNRKVSRWSDIKHQIYISFEESFLWTEKKIAYTRRVLSADLEQTTCPNCHWKGSATRQVQTPFGVMQTRTTCPNCNWMWNIFKKNWTTVSGTSIFEEKREEITLKIPSGIKDWVFIKYSGSGNSGLAWDWDLYIKINITPSKIYERKWDDLYIKVDVSIFDLVLWWNCDVMHPEWKITVKIPKWTQTNEKIKISWKGFGEWWIFSKKWNMYIETQIYIPKRLSKQQEKLRKELQDSK